jgi:DedD protein
MISFLKFKNNKNSEDDAVRTEPSIKSRRSVLEDEGQESMSENPEVQRARHRLLGAVFLLLIAIIGLPRIFDAEPKKIKNDVVIKVVSSVSESVNALEEKKPADNVIVPSSSSEEKIAAVNNTQNQDTKATPNNAADNNEVVISESASKEADKPKAKFYIQVAAFSTNDRVKKMSAKLKELKISSYVVERKKEAEGTTLYLLRSGPYTSREDAQAAVKKMAELEVTPKIIEMKPSQ